MKQEKKINTKELTIQGNIMIWEETMIQLSNVSCISTTPLVNVKFPKLSILLLFIGLAVLKSNGVFGVFLFSAGLLWIYFGWYLINEKRKKSTILTVGMNSGVDMNFLFSNKGFLDDVLRVLECILIEGDIGKDSIYINIHGCDISGNASILNDLNLARRGYSGSRD